MKRTKSNKRLLLMLMVIVLVFSNLEVALASEITESGILVESDDVTESAEFVVDEAPDATDNVDDINSTESDTGNDSVIEEAENDETDNLVSSETLATSEYNDDTLVKSNNEDEIENTSDITDVDDECDYEENSDIHLECETIVDSENETDEVEVAEKSLEALESKEIVKTEGTEQSKETEKEEVTQEEVQEDEEDDEFTIPAGVWSDKAPYFTDDTPMEASSRPFRMARAVGAIPTYQEVYESMTSLQDKYPEGMTWTNFTPYGRDGDAEYYKFQGGAIKGASLGVGCAAFVFILSDVAFGSIPARTIDRGGFNYEDIKAGDILRVNNNSHFVIVLQISTGGVIVAEANYNKSVHWGRAISKDEIMMADFLVTRYPEGYTEEDNADEIAYEGTEGSLRWTLTNGGILTISGTGDMLNYTTENGPSWNAYSNSINTIIIENGVTSIGDYAFYESKALTVYIPNGIKSIGSGAFQGANLVSVTIPSTTTNVGANAFRSCENLTSASISTGVETIGDNAFRGCRLLTYLDFPASIKSVGAGAFTSCDSVFQIRFEPSTENVTIGDSAFAQCWRLSSVTLPQGLTKISNFMFQSCTSLWKIYIPANVTDIGENPFTSTGIQYGGTICFEGSETTWKSIGGQFILNSMPNAIIEYDVEFNNPFAIDPDDPGDFKPVDPDNSGNSGGNDNTGTDTGDGSNTGTEKPNPSEPDENNPDNSDNSGGNDNTGTNTGESSNTGTKPITGNASTRNHYGSSHWIGTADGPKVNIYDIPKVDDSLLNKMSTANSTSGINMDNLTSNQDEELLYSKEESNIDGNPNIDGLDTKLYTDVEDTSSSISESESNSDEYSTDLQEDIYESQESDNTVLVVLAMMALLMATIIGGLLIGLKPAIVLESFRKKFKKK